MTRQEASHVAKYLAGVKPSPGSAALPMFWQLPPAFLAHTTQAAGIAMISSFGSIAAFLAPYLIGWMRDATQSASLALYVLALFIALGGLLVLRTQAAIVNPH